MRKLKDIILSFNLIMSDKKEKSMKTLSSTIEKKLENDEHLDDEYFKDDDEDIKKQQKKKKSEKKSEKQVEKQVVPSEPEKGKGIVGMIKEPLIIMILFIIVSHPKLSSILSKYIPFIKGDSSIMSLVFKGLLLAILYFVIKVFV